MPAQWDVFLSHGSPDKPWVESLAKELRALGLEPFLDLRAIEAADSYPQVLSEGLAGSRFLVLVLSPNGARPWVNLEWASYLAHHGPLGRLIPVLLEPTEVPALLSSIQKIDATDRDVGRVAREIARLAGRPRELKEGDARRLVLGQDLVFNLAWEEGAIRLTDPLGHVRKVTPPWKVDNEFGIARHFFDRLSREPAETDAQRAELVARATTLGRLLFVLLFDEEGVKRLRQAMIPGRPRPLITLRSEEDFLLALPWELLWNDGSFLVRDARVDVARSTPGDVGVEALLREASEPLKLVVNVSVPEGSRLDYEGESYRITRALAERCRFVPTELGSLDDLVETVHEHRPTAIHFSGHGAPGALAFEDAEGREDVVSIHALVDALRQRIDGALPPLFYLASCHGNDPGAAKNASVGAEKAESREEASGEGNAASRAESSAARLHREGVPQVVGYYGPIVDELSTRAEVAFYRALAEGETTRYAVRQARQALAIPYWAPEAMHKPKDLTPLAPSPIALPSSGRGGAAAQAATVMANDVAVRHTHPFAWAQIVFYHRGPDHPLSLPASGGVRSQGEVLQRTFAGMGDRRVLSTGFIGRRGELHRFRRRIREGERVFVFQGLGGLGKSTLAFQVLPMLLRGVEGGDALTLWCQEVEQRPDRAQGLVDQLLEHCRKRFGVEWEPVVNAVDRQAGADPVGRFVSFLQVLLQNVPRLVLYLDNLESLLVGPRESGAAESQEDEAAFGAWASPDLGRLWQILTEVARNGDQLNLVASCRYRNPDFASALLPVSPLPPDALFRLMGWFPALRRLCSVNRARLMARLAGHPRAVEYANDLLARTLAEREEQEGPWRPLEDPSEADLEREWAELVAPALPKVQDKLWANLLLAELWERVLDERARRMLFRMTLLRRPWEWKLAGVLGEEGEDENVAFATAGRLRGTSLLETVELLVRTAEGEVTARNYTLHPATAQFVRDRFSEGENFRKVTHQRLGDRFVAEALAAKLLETGLEAGYHLFQAGEFDRANELLGSAADWLREHGRTREGLLILEPFLTDQVREAMPPHLVWRLLDALGLAHYSLGEVEKAIAYYEPALAIVRDIGDRLGESIILNSLGLALADHGGVEKAARLYDQALVIAREIGHRRGEGNILGNLGALCHHLGEVKKAVGYYEQQLMITREIGDRRGESNALGNLGAQYHHLREVKKAVGYYKQQLVIAREIGDRRGEGNALGNLGVAYATLEGLENAIGFYEQQLVIVREIGDRRGEGNALGNIGVAYSRLGEVEKAIGFQERQLFIACEIGDRRGECSALGNLGIAYAEIGERHKATALLDQALEIGRAIKDPEMIRFTTTALARLREGGGAHMP